MKANFDPLYLRYPSQRYPLYARNGMVNCSTPQAASAGLEVLQKGGNAMDAAVAAAAAYTVVEPGTNGIGADCFALIWSEKDQKLFGLNSSGPAPMLASIERIKADGKDNDGKMPTYGWTPVTVSGAPKAWAEINKKFGKLSLAEDMAPAIRYAKDGYPVAANLATAWQRAYKRYKEILVGPEFENWFKTYTPEGRPYEAGEMVRLPDHGNSLELIANTNAEAFYTGELARAIDADSKKHGGYLRYEDLAAYQAQWVEPIRVNYKGYQVCEIPPNGQGIVALMALNILKEFDFPEKESALTYHRQLEAMKLAFADGLHYVTDPNHMALDYHDLLDPAYGAMRAKEIGDTAKVYTHAGPPKSGTVYMCCADGEGNMVSLIQSNDMGVGSGIVVEGTGIALQNRGADFTLNPEDPNCLKPGKRTYHTIIPGFLLNGDGSPVGPFGVMGGYMQPQGHVQVVMNYVDFHMNPQQALDAPRWQWMRGGNVTVETRFSDEMAQALLRRGHNISYDIFTPNFGRGQMIVRLDNGVLVGGAESRTDSNIALY